MSAAWLPGNMLAFDTETTGVDPLTARIVSATCVEVGAAGVVSRETWLVNPGVPIPAEASAIHGITDLMAAGGLAPLIAITAIVDRLKRAWAAGLPVVIMNAPFDTTILAVEAERIALDPFEVGPVLDPLVIDRAIDPYRKGKRTLAALAAHYRVKLDGAHSSDGDALGAARIVWKQSKELWPMSKFTLAQIQDWQACAYAAWARNFEAHLAEKGTPQTINGEWPIRRPNADPRAA